MSPILDHLAPPPAGRRYLLEEVVSAGAVARSPRVAAGRGGAGSPAELGRAVLEVMLVIGLCILLPAIPFALLGVGADQASESGGASLDLETIAWALVLQSALLTAVGLGMRRRHALDRVLPGSGPGGPGLDAQVQLALGVLGGFGALAGSFVLSIALTALGTEPSEQEWIVAFARGDGPWPLVLVLLAAVAVPVAEEVLFRGYAFERVLRAGGPFPAYVVSTLLFAAVHVNPSAIVIYLYLGLVMAWLYHRTGGLVAPITAHAVNNGVAFALLLLAPGS